MSESALMQVSEKYVKPNKPCFSRSGTRTRNDAQKSDIAISQGIALEEVEAWVGTHFQPCVSDAHNMVLVAGALEAVAAPELDRVFLVRDSNPSPFPRPPMPLRAPPTDEEVSVAPAAEAAGPPQWALPEATAAVDAAPGTLRVLAGDSQTGDDEEGREEGMDCLLYTSPSPRDGLLSRMPSSA